MPRFREVLTNLFLTLAFWALVRRRRHQAHGILGSDQSFLSEADGDGAVRTSTPLGASRPVSTACEAANPFQSTRTPTSEKKSERDATPFAFDTKNNLSPNHDVDTTESLKTPSVITAEQLGREHVRGAGHRMKRGPKCVRDLFGNR